MSNEIIKLGIADKIVTNIEDLFQEELSILFYFIANIQIQGEENMIKINETPEKLNPRKRNIQLKNISLHDLHLIDTDTGENITQEVIDALPEGTETIDFKISVELPEEE